MSYKDADFGPHLRTFLLTRYSPAADQLCQRLNDHVMDDAVLRADLRLAMEALEPVAELYEEWMSAYMDHERVNPEYTRLRYGDLRRAEELLSDLKAKYPAEGEKP